MARIIISRDNSGKVTFEDVSVNITENLFFRNEDAEPHRPELLAEPLAPGENSDAVPVPLRDQPVPYDVPYRCLLHENETGVIHVFAILATKKTALTATQGQSTTEQVVEGGKPPYLIDNVTVTDAGGTTTNVPGASSKPGERLPISPGLELAQNAKGVWVVGTPTQPGSYNVTFRVDDAMGQNLQQVQCSLTVNGPGAPPASPRRVSNSRPDSIIAATILAGILATMGGLSAGGVRAVIQRASGTDRETTSPNFISPIEASSPAQNAGLPAFANPGEIRSRDGEKRLRGIIQISTNRYKVPDGITDYFRQYSGWDPAQPAPTACPDSETTTATDAPRTRLGPGPTLRARLGDKVEISFLNEVNEAEFPNTKTTVPTPVQTQGQPSSGGCDKVEGVYPGNDIFPDCFHGSNTANIHFHGTHTNPDGLGDDVFVQVLPQVPQPQNWAAMLDKMFDEFDKKYDGKNPPKWTDLPEDYRDGQMKILEKEHHDLFEKNQELINGGQWPQYFVGAFPNFFEIPDYDADPGKFKAGQAPGTHWYHAHKHGSTSLHILNGLAGAFVIESSAKSGYDYFIRNYYGWGDAYCKHEKIMVFQQFDSDQNLERGPEPERKKALPVFVNGLLKPTISMAPSEVQLWRLVNATEGNSQGVIDGSLWGGAVIGNGPDAGKDPKRFNVMQTAQDGVQFSPDNYKNQPFLNPNAPSGRVPGGLTLASGNRADLLVQAPKTPGLYVFQYGFGNNRANTAILFFVKVEGPADAQPAVPTPAFPTTWVELPKFLKDLPAPDPKSYPNVVQFQWEPLRAKPGPSPAAPHFMINNKQFAQMGEVVDQCMPLDGLQDWVLENYTSEIAHPFHIHINPFQVLEIDTPTANGYATYTPPNNFVWQDVIAIPPALISKDGKQITPGRVRIRHTFVDFPGTFVLHCHILAHEDRGMMQMVRVVRNYPNDCQQTLPAHH